MQGAGPALTLYVSVCSFFTKHSWWSISHQQGTMQEDISAHLVETGSLGLNLKKLTVKTILKGLGSAKRGKGWVRWL